MAAHGYTSWETYQPASRFWHFQSVEAGAYGLAALVLAAATFRWIRRRASGTRRDEAAQPSSGIVDTWRKVEGISRSKMLSEPGVAASQEKVRVFMKLGGREYTVCDCTGR